MMVKDASKADLELCYMPATKALKLSPVELMDAVIKRAEEVEPKINAFANTYFEEALAAAKKAEKRYMKGKARPLEGLPLAVKDEAPIAGQPNTSGSLIYKDQIAEETSPTNERLLKAGAIVHARTTTPEFCCAGYCHTKLWGVTRNPWNMDFTPGGTSGGSGAALAAGTAALATGSDIAGSIRIPASCSGVVGFKPPYGRNPQMGGFVFDSYCHEGPMARTVGEAAWMQNVMSGLHPHDIATLRDKVDLPTSGSKPIKGWKIAYSLDLGYFAVDPDVLKNTKKALKTLEGLGATLEEVKLPWTLESEKAALAHLTIIFGGYVAGLLEEHADEMTPYGRTFGEMAANYGGDDLINAWGVATEMYQTMGPLLERYDAFVCPTLAVPAVPAEFDQSRDKLEIAGQQVNPFVGWLMTYPFNMLSRCPVLSVPSGRAKNGVPTGLQIVARTYDDKRAFRAAAAFMEESKFYADTRNRPKV